MVEHILALNAYHEIKWQQKESKHFNIFVGEKKKGETDIIRPVK